MFAEAMATRAVISGRRKYENAGRWNGDHHNGVPIFVLTHDVPDDRAPGSVRYFTDVRECAESARASAGDGDVLAMGAGVARALVSAEELDEIELHVVPVLLGRGRRLFEELPDERVELELIRCLIPAAENREQQVTQLRRHESIHRCTRSSPTASRRRSRRRRKSQASGRTPLIARLAEAVSLQRMDVVATPAATHLRFRVMGKRHDGT